MCLWPELSQIILNLAWFQRNVNECKGQLVKVEILSLWSSPPMEKEKRKKEGQSADCCDAGRGWWSEKKKAHLWSLNSKTFIKHDVLQCTLYRTLPNFILALKGCMWSLGKAKQCNKPDMAFTPANWRFCNFILYKSSIKNNLLPDKTLEKCKIFTIHMPNDHSCTEWANACGKENWKGDCFTLLQNLWIYEKTQTPIYTEHKPFTTKCKRKHACKLHLTKYRLGVKRDGR